MKATGEAMGVVVLVGLASTIATLGVLHVLPTGLSPLTTPVSQYGIGRYAIGYRIATIGLGTACAAAAIGISVALHDTSALAVACLGAAALARFVISWFPMDEPGATPTATGRNHGLIALATFAAITIAAFALHNCLVRIDAWSGALGLLTVISWFLLATGAGMALMRRLPSVTRYFGTVERLFYLSTFAFVALVGVELLQTT